MDPSEVRAGQRWTARNGVDPDIQIAGRAPEFDGWRVTWSGIGQSDVQLWATDRILEDYVLAVEPENGVVQLTDIAATIRMQAGPDGMIRRQLIMFLWVVPIFCVVTFLWLWFGPDGDGWNKLFAIAFAAIVAYVVKIWTRYRSQE